GRTLAEELLPAFKRRFDLVERGQLNKVVEELKLEGSDLVENWSGRQELGRLARVHYLVFGSVSRLGCLVIHARLVDVRSGLVLEGGRGCALCGGEWISGGGGGENVLMSGTKKSTPNNKKGPPGPPRGLRIVGGPAPPPGGPLGAAARVPPPIMVYTPRPP